MKFSQSAPTALPNEGKPLPALLPPFAPVAQTVVTHTIDYAYDSLYRLSAADYSNGDYFHYTYDAADNRLTETTRSSVTSYQYDLANRLASVDSVPYSYDNNGNLLSDGVNSYVYDSAREASRRGNRLISVNGTTTYSYNGLGDRLTQNGTQYTLDLNAGLTQVLDDGTNIYTYGIGRVAQADTSTEYFLGDALGSVRQLTDASGAITLAKSYAPYGEGQAHSRSPWSRLPRTLPSRGGCSKIPIRPSKVGQSH